MRSIEVDGIPSRERVSYGEPKPPTHARWRPPLEYPDVSIAVAVGQIIGLTIGSYVATEIDRVRRALPPVANVVAILPALPMLVWHTVLYCLVEPLEQRRGERR